MDLTDGLHYLTIAGAGALLRSGAITSTQLTQASLARIDAVDPIVHAYAGLMADAAMTAAAGADASFIAGVDLGPLQGIPVAVKDLLHTAGYPTEAGSRVLRGFIPSHDATVVAKLRANGAVILGKTITHEFAYGQDKPVTRNAWANDCYPGGSSAGSGVAVAVGTAFGTIGTDTGGSVRVPAAVNGVVGLKPTFGRVSTRGVVPMSPSLDSVGPMARTVRDVALLLGAVAGPGEPDQAGLRDYGALIEPVPDYAAALTGDLSNVRIGIERRQFFSSMLTDEVRAAVESAIGCLASAGAEFVDVELENIELSVPAGMAVLVADTSEWHQAFLRGRGDHYVPEVRVMLELGEMVLATAYVKAQKTRTVIQRSYRAMFERHSLTAMLAPTIPTTTMPVDDLNVDLTGSGATATSGFIHHNFLANVIGVPSLSVPVGFGAADKPIGMQLYGRPFGEPDLFRIGDAYQGATTWHLRHPDLPTPSQSRNAAAK